MNCSDPSSADLDMRDRHSRDHQFALEMEKYLAEQGSKKILSFPKPEAQADGAPGDEIA